MAHFLRWRCHTAKPSAPSVGTRLICYPTPDELSGGCAPLPAIVISGAGVGPDYLGMIFVVFAADGSVRVKTGVVNLASWATNGRDPAVARWDFATFQHELRTKMAIVRKIQFRQQARGAEEIPFPGICGRRLEDECGLKDPLECQIHGPLLLEPSREESEEAMAQARAIAQTFAAGWGRAPGY